MLAHRRWRQLLADVIEPAGQELAEGGRRRGDLARGDLGDKACERALSLTLRAVDGPAQLTGSRRGCVTGQLHDELPDARPSLAQRSPHRRRTVAKILDGSWMVLRSPQLAPGEIAAEQVLCGAQSGNRTHDLRITSALLYRLSYLGRAGQCSEDRLTASCGEKRCAGGQGSRDPPRGPGGPCHAPRGRSAWRRRRAAWRRAHRAPRRRQLR